MREVFWDQDDIILRLRRLEGQVRGVQSMVQDQKSCRDILIQVAAVEGAIHTIARIINACSVAEAMTGVLGPTDDVQAVRSALVELLR
jgi:DNA-binding FrmR family transcriptional regulator